MRPSRSGRLDLIMLMEEEEPKEWVAQVEPGVLITFVSMSEGGNDLKRIRFRHARHICQIHLPHLVFPKCYRTTCKLS
ncbi:hypothetical protein MKX01_032040 [Papaver californicum]|nr:hypothetical protein MKX01_032040 [Papaver californicum]